MHSKRLKFLVYLALFPLCAFAALAQTNLPGNALLLSGTNQFAYVNSPLLATNGSFTLEIWARRNRTNVQEYLFSLGQSSQTNRYLRMGFRSNDTFVVSFFSNDLVTATSYTDTNWHHWAATFDANSGARCIFRDATLLTNDISLAGLAAGGKFLIGGDNTSTPPFGGAVDEIRVWNTALSAAQITTNLHRSLAGNEPGLIAYYRCDRIAGGTIPDATTNNHPAILDGPISLTPSGVEFVPNIITLPATNATTNQVTLQGTLNPMGIPTTAWFQWGTVSGYYFTNTPVQSIGTGTNAVLFSEVLSNLFPAAVYYYRAVGSNDAGVNYGPEMSFQPLGYGSALRFDGTNGVVATAATNYLNAYPLTITAWIQTSQVSSNEVGLAGNYVVSSVNGYQLYLLQGNLRAWYFSGNFGNRIFGDQQGNPEGVDGGFIADGAWHHVAFVVDSSGGKLYVDGKVTGSLPWIGTPGAPSSTLPLRFGLYDTNHFQGNMDEIRLWNRALSGDEIRAGIFRKTAPADPGLIGSWSFAEGAGNVTLDNSSNSLSTVVSNGVSWIPSMITENYTVTGTNDSGPGSLREALTFLTGANIELDTAGPIETIGTYLTAYNSSRIEGLGNQKVIRRHDTADTYPELYVHMGRFVQLDNLAIENGSAYSGGGIYSDGALDCSHCLISSNSVSYDGAGIYVSPFAAFWMRNCEISDNESADSGGGMRIDCETIDIRDCTIARNFAQQGGGVIFQFSFGLAPSASFQRCAIIDNVASESGGAIYSINGDLNVGFTNCTMAGNVGGNTAACYCGGGAFTFVHCTVVDNMALFGAAITSDAGATPTLDNCIIGRTTGLAAAPVTDLKTNVFSTFRFLGNNLIQNTNGLAGLALSHVIAGVDPMLGLVADNGGPTPTCAVLPGSPAWNAGAYSEATFSTDQRGYPRIRGSAPDLGAYELSFNSITVTNTADDGPGTLRQAVSDLAPGGTIQFATNLLNQTITFGSEIALTYDATIQGLGAAHLTLDGNGAHRLLHVNSGHTTVNDLALVNGRTRDDGALADQSGGAIISGAALDVNRCYFAGNYAAFDGGAIALFPGAAPVANITDCTFMQNRVNRGGNGGAVEQGLIGVSGNSVASILRCTFSANGPLVTNLSGDVWGGAIANMGGQMTIAECTANGNVADQGGGLFNYQGTVSVKNSIFAGNIAAVRGPDVDLATGAEGGTGGIASLGHNLIGDRSGQAATAFLANADISGASPDVVNPLLGSLAYNGGPTPTLALLAGSPAIDAGGAATGPTDQRGFPRVRGAAMDIGAYEALRSILLTASENNGQLQLQFEGEPGTVYTILGTTNLALPIAAWSPMGAPTEFQPGQFQFSPAVSNSATQMFFRVRGP